MTDNEIKRYTLNGIKYVGIEIETMMGVAVKIVTEDTYLRFDGREALLDSRIIVPLNDLKEII